MLADQVDYVVGVDTHRDEHVLAVVVAATGVVVAQRSVRASGRGYAEALRFAAEHAVAARVWAVEGAGHYGAGLARFLSGRGETVLEIGRGRRDERRLRGKDDSLDATRAARTALASETLTLPRAGQRREALRLLLLARRSAVDVRRQALVQLRSVIVTCPDGLREELRGLPVQSLIKRCSRLRRSTSRTPDELAATLVLRSLAQRVKAVTTEAAELEAEILAHVRALAPQLLNERGVGPIVAAQLIIAWSHPGRVRSEAAFARLAGVAPIPASSGQTVRHRLSRGGDRQLNRALHTVILQRRQHDPATKAYIERRVSEGKSRRDAVRLLKRSLARHLYRILNNQTPLMT
ncbi:MAG: IS110 family transposase [Chloroflexota bacterium]|nr:IS110 family transposase [Chloroflexota bacterium]